MPSPALPVVALHATDADDASFGDPVALCAARGWTYVAQPRLVWFNPAERARVHARIAHLAPLHLVGFSKSGLGALNLALDHPGLARAVSLFDVPLLRDPHPTWETGRFYPDLAAYRRDLPLQRLPALRTLLAGTDLTHIGGELFHDDHAAFQRALGPAAACRHLDAPQLRHRWDAAWADLVAQSA